MINNHSFVESEDLLVISLLLLEGVSLYRVDLKNSLFVPDKQLTVSISVRIAERMV